MAHAPLSLLEREEIGAALIADRDASWASIARRIDRHPGTVAREVTEHGGRRGYRPAVAQGQAEAARTRPRTARLAQSGALRDRVTAELRRGRSPEAIWADMDAEQLPGRVRPETIYAAIYAGVLEVAARDCLRSRRPRRRHRQERCASKRAGLPNIAARPVIVNERGEPGHWEADGIVGARNRSYMLWLTERVSRYSIPVTMPVGYTAEATLAGLVEAFEQIPAHLRLSVTFDQGSEWAEWETLAASYGLDVWFCDPHSPWQRGQVENLNRQWRWWFPRGTDLAAVSQADADHAATIINGQRRRSLHYRSPAMLYSQLTAR